MGKKIPGECPICHDRLRQDEMEGFLRRCEKQGKDPIEVAYETTPPGVLCTECFARVINDELEAGNPTAKRVLTRMRKLWLGVEELPDGKPVTWH
jgi:hypothetical protein